ncbi:hypothetical protein AGMMS50255_2540 [Spirochaetia bacterium]|nr:hypothetical protein AGMMS50255_2540 [Spirochaetia bacterium]
MCAEDKRGVSATRLQKELEISYPTAWLMLQKIRKAMEDRDEKYQLAGIVELDDSYFGAPKEGGKRGRGSEKAKVLVGVSLDKQGRPLQVKMSVVDTVKSAVLVDFAEKNIVEGSTINSDAFSSYYKAFGDGTYGHQPLKFDYKENPDHLKWLHTMISNAKAFIGGTYHGLGTKHLQAYLSEFCFRANRRMFKTQLFNRLLCACTATATITYKNLVAGIEPVLT